MDDAISNGTAAPSRIILSQVCQCTCADMCRQEAWQQRPASKTLPSLRSCEGIVPTCLLHEVKQTARFRIGSTATAGSRPALALALAEAMT